MSRDDFLLPSAVQAIGRTPLVELSRLTRDLDGRILAKLEYPYSKTVLKRRSACNPNRAAANVEEKDYSLISHLGTTREKVGRRRQLCVNQEDSRNNRGRRSCWFSGDSISSVR